MKRTPCLVPSSRGRGARPSSGTCGGDIKRQAGYHQDAQGKIQLMPFWCTTQSKRACPESKRWSRGRVSRSRRRIVNVVMPQTNVRLGGGRRGGCTHYLACHSHIAIDLASLQSQDGACRVFAGPGGRIGSIPQGKWQITEATNSSSADIPRH